MRKKIFSGIIMVTMLFLFLSCGSVLKREDINTLPDKNFTVTRVGFQSSGGILIDLYDFNNKMFKRHMAKRIPVEKLASILSEEYGININGDEASALTLESFDYSSFNGMYWEKQQTEQEKENSNRVTIEIEARHKSNSNASPSNYFDIKTEIKLITPQGKKYIRFTLPDGWGIYYVPKCKNFNCSKSAHAIVYSVLGELDKHLKKEIAEN